MKEEVSRRGFLELTGATGMAALSGGTFGQTDTTVFDEEDFERAGLLIGPEDARPAKNGPYLQQWDTYHFAYFATDTGRKWQSTHLDGGWNRMATEFTGPETQVGEVVTTDFESWINHTFARPNAPDDKNWEYTAADITKDGPEIQLASSTALVAKQRGNYAAGSEAIPGVAWRVTATPTGGEAFAGYFEDSDDDNIPEEGMGFGSDATSDFVWIAKAGTLHRIRQADWNGASVPDRPFVNHYPRISRLPHLYYGGGAIRWRLVDHEGVEPVLKTIHTETPENLSNQGAPFDSGPPLDQPNLPPAFTSNGLSGGSLRANAAHYNLGDGHAEKRINGEHFTAVDAGTTGWTPLISWRKRTGWEGVNVEPLRVLVSAVNNDAKLELQLGTTLDANASFSRPTHTDADETAVEIDTSGGISSNGQRRWPGFAAAGQGASSGGIQPNDLEFNLPSADVVTLAAQGVGGTATLSGAVAWEEYF